MPLRFLERSVWPWPAAGCTLLLPLDLLIMTTLANLVVILVTNYMSATYVINAFLHRSSNRRPSSFHIKPVGKI